MRSVAVAGVLASSTLLSGLLAVSSAYATNINGVHWERHSTTIAQAYMVDHTPSFWPVTDATYNWNNGTNRVGVYYRWSTCPSSSAHCVHIREYRDGDGSEGARLCGGDFGCTIGHRPGDSSGHITDGHGNSSTVRIWLNRSVNSSSDALQTTCHEVGHVIGLDHRSASSSCMTVAVASGTPDSHDFSTLNGVYDH